MRFSCDFRAIFVRLSCGRRRPTESPRTTRMTNRKKHKKGGGLVASGTKKIADDLRLFYVQRPAPTIRLTAEEKSITPQSYFPSLEILFPSLKDQTSGTPTLAARELAVSIDVSSSVIEDLETKKRTNAVPTWLRMVHLINPVDVMSGDLVIPTDGALPAWREAWQRTLRKINNPYNEAYTDAVFACLASRLVETRRTPHFCRFYGTYNARIPEYRYNISDDLGDIEGEHWFADGLKESLFRIIASDPDNPGVMAEVQRPWDDVRERLGLGLDLGHTLSTSETESVSSKMDCDFSSKSSNSSKSSKSSNSSKSSKSSDSELEECDINISGSAVINRGPVQISRSIQSQSGSGSGSGSGSYDSNYSSDDIEYHVLIKNFPVQITVLERCEGTMDSLMELEEDNENEKMAETKEERWTAWMFQVIAGLTVAQQLFDFVHNDLHTNNVMWSTTTEPYLYYHITGSSGGDRYYKVPTFGKIMKIIDFGRATFRPDTHMWFPDAFDSGADAGGQYNCGQNYNKDFPKVVPNKSFDLCRLSVAMLDTLWDSSELKCKDKILTKEPNRIQHETESPLWNLMWLWLTDLEGRNVLRNPDNSERYPQFDLYCAIARDIQNAVPSQQLTLPLFDSAFAIAKKEIPADSDIWKLVAH